MSSFGLSEALRFAALHSREITTMTPALERVSPMLFQFLSHLCTRGRAAAVIAGMDQQNGFECWRRLCMEYEPPVGDRYVAMLLGVLQPKAWESMSLAQFAVACLDL